MQSKGELIAQYEARMTTSVAMDDFLARNDPGGTAHVEPTDSAVLDDDCVLAISEGEIPINDIALTLPAHPRCSHGSTLLMHLLITRTCGISRCITVLIHITSPARRGCSQDAIGDD
jgi:hypothetical protein